MAKFTILERTEHRRCEVLTVSAEDKRALVRMIDLGDEVWLPFADLKYPDSDVMSVSLNPSLYI